MEHRKAENNPAQTGHAVGKILTYNKMETEDSWASNVIIAWSIKIASSDPESHKA